MWIFAQTTEADAQYIVVGGYYVERARRDRITSPDTDKIGAVIRLGNDHCELIGPARDVFDYPPQEIAPSKLTELANNAVCRYSRAFGSYQKFRDAIRHQRISLSTGQSPVLKTAVFAPQNGCR